MFSIETVDLSTAEGLVAEQLNAIWNRHRLEALPDDSPIPLEEQLHGWHNIPEFITVHELLLWNEEHTSVDAVGEIEYYTTEENPHRAFFDIYVPPENRRRGLGKLLLGRLAPIAIDHERPMMLCRTNERIPAGQAFVERIGASRGMDTRTSQLPLNELDREWVKRWRNPPTDS